MLETALADLEQKTSTEMAVVTVTSLEGQPVDAYANTLFKRWGIGKKGENNGILLLVSIQDRQGRIEVGYGLEPVLPDAFCGDVLRHQIAPAFRGQRYAEGLSSAVRAMAERLKNPSSAGPADKKMSEGLSVNVLLLLLAILVAAPCTVASFLLIGLLHSRSTLVVLLLPVGILLDVLIWRRRIRSGMFSGTGPYGGGWSGGGLGGGFGGFSGGFGGFGGGSSGGGGASGRW
jgi:uncharacterized protein